MQPVLSKSAVGILVQVAVDGIPAVVAKPSLNDVDELIYAVGRHFQSLEWSLAADARHWQLWVLPAGEDGIRRVLNEAEGQVRELLRRWSARVRATVSVRFRLQTGDVLFAGTRVMGGPLLDLESWLPEVEIVV